MKELIKDIIFDIYLSFRVKRIKSRLEREIKFLQNKIKDIQSVKFIWERIFILRRRINKIDKIMTDYKIKMNKKYRL